MEEGEAYRPVSMLVVQVATIGAAKTASKCGCDADGIEAALVEAFQVIQRTVVKSSEIGVDKYTEEKLDSPATPLSRCGDEFPLITPEKVIPSFRDAMSFWQTSSRNKKDEITKAKFIHTVDSLTIWTSVLHVLSWTSVLRCLFWVSVFSFPAFDCCITFPVLGFCSTLPFWLLFCISSVRCLFSISCFGLPFYNSCLGLLLFISCFGLLC